MKLWVFSDLHRDYQGWPPPAAPHADVCVVAGDVGERLLRSLEWLRDTVATHMPVVFVAGNHEFYRTGLTEVLREARDRAGEFPGVHFLDDGELVLGGVRFLGCSLWTDFALDGPGAVNPAIAHARALMNDYRRVKWSKLPYRRFTPELSRALHFRSRAFLDAALGKPFDGPTVVVTHHAPHPNSLEQTQAASRVDAAYASDMSELMLRHHPDLWLHGHVHRSVDYRVGDTRVLSNPRGYGDENPAFDPALVVEVGR